MTAYNNRIVYLSDAQRQELFSNGSITVGGVTINYDPNDIYVTPQGVNMSIGTVSTLPAGSEATAAIRGTVDNPILDLGIPGGINHDSVPTSSSSTGSKGDICVDENYIYVCVATNMWKRVQLGTWNS